MSTLGLVHGGLHGAWCWSLLIPELEKLGHRAVAVDLPITDPQAGGLAYATAARDAFQDCPDDMVLVGHSMGGLVIPVVATLRPAARLVYLCAALPEPGRSFVEQMADDPEQRTAAATDGRILDGTGTMTYPPEAARRIFYHDVPDELARWAESQLRPQVQRAMTEVTPLRAWPDLPSTYILGREDRCLDPSWQRRNVPRRLGITPLEIDGSHSPFLARPRELAEMLDAAIVGQI